MILGITTRNGIPAVPVGRAGEGSMVQELKHTVAKVAPHSEHIAGVSYAACEVFHLHEIIYFVSCIIFISGLIIIIVRKDA